MGNITTNISRYELACGCGCSFDTGDYETLIVVQDTCDHFAAVLNTNKVILNIHSACRCYTYNTTIGGSKDSWHIKARALDFHIKDIQHKNIFDYLCAKYPDKFGVGLYLWGIHFDSRKIKARWINV